MFRMFEGRKLRLNMKPTNRERGNSAVALDMKVVHVNSSTSSIVLKIVARGEGGQTDRKRAAANLHTDQRLNYRVCTPFNQQPLNKVDLYVNQCRLTFVGSR